MNLPNVNYLHAAAILFELAARGVKDIVISPGSRSTPLARTAALMKEFRCATILDERSAAFFALGLSKSSENPAVLICTSGTAGANYYPAVIEAAQSFTPLIVLTADRPLALRHCGAPQTIDQENLYGNYVRFFADVPEAKLDEQGIIDLRKLTAHAWAAAQSEPRGPVHLNIPFDEPLAPVCDNETECNMIWERAKSAEILVAVRGAPLLASEDANEIAKNISGSLCGLIVAGPHAAQDKETATAIFKLGRALGWPVFADIVSGIRHAGDPVIPYYDIFLRAENLPKPDFVIEFGSCPTSKVLNEYLNRCRPTTIRIQPHAKKLDPHHRAAKTYVADIAAACDVIAHHVPVARDSLLLEPFSRFSALLRRETQNIPECEAAFVQKIIQSLPNGANLVVASSLPVRYADSFAAFDGKQHRVFAQRGTNGIDGTVSHAAGVAFASDQPTLLICGDLAFLHDLGGLMAANKVVDKLTILLLNNDGGGIFSFLPIAKFQDTFEQIHGTPHGLDLSLSRELFNLDWKTISSLSDLSYVSLRQTSDKLRVIEVKSNRTENQKRHEQMIAGLLAVIQ